MAIQPQPYHPLIYTYLKKWQDDPTSRVFAPLAEAYRKAGLPKEAIDIARDGLRHHPSFVGGRVALARALFDIQEYDQVINELTLVVRDAPDNIVAQRLLAESCLIRGHVSEALGAYKMLLYFSPQDLEAAQIVRELETQAYEGGKLVLRKDPPVAEIRQFDVKPAREAIESDPALKRQAWIKRIEVLQGLLVKVERYKKAAPHQS